MSAQTALYLRFFKPTVFQKTAGRCRRFLNKTLKRKPQATSNSERKYALQCGGLGSACQRKNSPASVKEITTRTVLKMTNEARLIQRNRTTGIAQGNKTAATEEPAAAAKPRLSNPGAVKGDRVMHETSRERATRLTRCACAQPKPASCSTSAKWCEPALLLWLP